MTQSIFKPIRHRIQHYLNATVPLRQKNVFQKTMLEILRQIRPQDVRQVETLCQTISQGCRVSIRSCADNVPDDYHRFQGGDYWAKYELTLALGWLGYHVTDIDPDVVIHLFGSKINDLPERAHKIIWIYSHPERVSPELLKKYDRIFCLSKPLNEHINQMGFKSEFAPGATARTSGKQDLHHDIVFVGNTRTGVTKGRWIINDLGETTHRLKVWGRGWDAYLKPDQIGGQYFDYTRLPELYASAHISLCDHAPAMREQGFVALRVFDILTSGGFCICDNNSGLSEIFGDAVPAYTSPAHLQELINLYMTDEPARQSQMKKGREIAHQYTWENRARQLLQNIDPEWK